MMRTNKANLVREMLQEEFAQVFKDVDAIALPTSQFLHLR